MCVHVLVVAPTLYVCILVHRYLKLEKETNSLTALHNNERLLHLMKKLHRFLGLNEITVSHLQASAVQGVHTHTTHCCYSSGVHSTYVIVRTWFLVGAP